MTIEASSAQLRGSASADKAEWWASRRALDEQLAAQLPNASQDQQRMLLGEALYPLVDAVEPASSAKITGMLLEMDQSEVLHLIEDSKALSDKVQEAVSVLKQASDEA